MVAPVAWLPAVLKMPSNMLETSVGFVVRAAECASRCLAVALVSVVSTSTRVWSSWVIWRS